MKFNINRNMQSDDAVLSLDIIAFIPVKLMISFCNVRRKLLDLMLLLLDVAFTVNGLTLALPFYS